MKNSNEKDPPPSQDPLPPDPPPPPPIRLVRGSIIGDISVDVPQSPSVPPVLPQSEFDS